MTELPNCPKCQSSYVYEDGSLLVCPECAYEWSPSEAAEAEADAQIKDANGNVLQDGDHDIDCKIDGFGAMKLKSEFVKKI